jgi:hypothetical protein
MTSLKLIRSQYRSQPRSARPQAVRKTPAMRRGRVEFYDDTAKKPRCLDCTTAALFSLRAFENGHGAEDGGRGWWALTVTDEPIRTFSAGPFATLAEADRIGRTQAERLGCRYIAATAEEIAEAADTEREWHQEAAAYWGNIDNGEG